VYSRLTNKQTFTVVSCRRCVCQLSVLTECKHWHGWSYNAQIARINDHHTWTYKHYSFSVLLFIQIYRV